MGRIDIDTIFNSNQQGEIKDRSFFGQLFTELQVCVCMDSQALEPDFNILQIFINLIDKILHFIIFM